MRSEFQISERSVTPMSSRPFQTSWMSFDACNGWRADNRAGLTKFPKAFVGLAFRRLAFSAIARECFSIARDEVV